MNEESQICFESNIYYLVNLHDSQLKPGKMKNAKQDVKEELQKYLEDKDINALFVSIVESLLIEKPDDPIEFVFKFLLVS